MIIKGGSWCKATVTMTFLLADHTLKWQWTCTADSRVKVQGDGDGDHYTGGWCAHMMTLIASSQVDHLTMQQLLMQKWICKHKGLIPESIYKAYQSIWPVNRQGWRYEHFGPDNSDTPGSHGQEVLMRNSRIAEGRTEAMQLAESMRTRKKEKYANWRSRRKVSRCK
jgi:hypothetical protein